jgi:hypothetical protein
MNLEFFTGEVIVILVNPRQDLLCPSPIRVREDLAQSYL